MFLSAKKLFKIFLNECFVDSSLNLDLIKFNNSRIYI